MEDLSNKLYIDDALTKPDQGVSAWVYGAELCPTMSLHVHIEQASNLIQISRSQEIEVFHRP